MINGWSSFLRVIFRAHDITNMGIALGIVILIALIIAYRLACRRRKSTILGRGGKLLIMRGKRVVLTPDGDFYVVGEDTIKKWQCMTADDRWKRKAPIAPPTVGQLSRWYDYTANHEGEPYPTVYDNTTISGSQSH